jgi:L-threonylcarbamoyladenylate synthase
VNRLTQILPIESDAAQKEALHLLQTGGLVAFPTDTVYGVGASAFHCLAVEEIYRVKDRPNEKAIPVLLGDIKDLVRVTSVVPAMAWNLAAHYWPGPLTLVVPKHPDLAEAVSSGDTVAVRIPDHAATRRLLIESGPLAVSSANRSGGANPSTAAEVEAQLGGRIPLILDGGRTPGGIPSTLVDCCAAEPRILRTGPVTEDEIRILLRKIL